jgi:hypothetical protein
MAMSDARSTGSTSGINNSFDLAKKIEIDLNFTPRTARFIAHVSLISIYCSSLSSAPKPDEITIKISEDESGDRYILTSTDTDLEYGSTDNTKASAQIKLDGIVSLERADTIYVQVKTNQGSLTVDEIVITYNDWKK